MRPRAGSPPAEGLVPASLLRREDAPAAAVGEQRAAPETPTVRRKTSRPAGGGAAQQLDDQRA